MRHRFLLHSLSHTVLVVDITAIGLPAEIYPPDGETKTVPSLRFQSWEDAEQYFLRLGADAQTLQETFQRLTKLGVGGLTIV
jgi:hypothetical protein